MFCSNSVEVLFLSVGNDEEWVFLNDVIVDNGEACECVGDEGVAWLHEDDDVENVDLINTGLVLSLFNEIWSTCTLEPNLDILVEWDFLQYFDPVYSNTLFFYSPSRTRNIKLGYNLITL